MRLNLVVAVVEGVARFRRGAMARLPSTVFTVAVAWISLSLVVYYYFVRRQLEASAKTIGVPTADPQKAIDYEGLLASKDGMIAMLAEKVLKAEQALRSNSSMRNGSQDSGRNESAFNVTEGDPMHPNHHVLSILDFLPHLNGSVKWLQPYLTTGRKKNSVTVVLGVPHVYRPKASYLMTTLQSLITNMKPRDMEQTVIVIQVSEPWNLTYYRNICEQVSAQFGQHVETGLIEVIMPPSQFYPDLDSVPTKWGDNKMRTKWRTKQNLDYIFLMSYCAGRGTFYVQLEDDIVAMPDYIATMVDYSRIQEGYLVLEFSSLGFIGKLFRSENLLAFVEFVSLFYEHKPIDLLLFSYINVRECFADDCPNLANVVKKFNPSLFNHIGYESSLLGKVQLAEEAVADQAGKQSGDPAVVSHTNPPATVSTSLKQYKEFSLVNCYNGLSVFWALNPQPDDFIAFTFPTPAAVARYRFLTGDARHASDKAHDATVEVLPADETAATLWKAPVTADRYLIISKFNENALVGYALLSLAEGPVPALASQIKALRITFHSASQNWFILKEVHIELAI